MSQFAYRHTVRIAVMSDMHIAARSLPESTDRFERLMRAIDSVNASSADLVLVPGDMTENGNEAELRTVMETLRRLLPPVRCVPGNHDIGDKILPGRPGVTSHRIRSYETLAGPASFVEDVAGLRLIALNAPVMGSGLPEEWDQWNRLEEALTETAACPKVVLLHYPPFINDPGEPAGDYWTLEKAPRMRLLEAARRGAVSLIVSGHMHRPIMTQCGGVTLATAPSLAFGLPFGVQPKGWMMLSLKADGSVGRDLRLDEAPPSITSSSQEPV
jgi:3',5'-cyclic AMP phosphodiesterase CpdA